MLEFFPSDEKIKVREEHIAQQALANGREKLLYSEERAFQDELLRTLAMVFENDFKDNYAEKRFT